MAQNWLHPCSHQTNCKGFVVLFVLSNNLNSSFFSSKNNILLLPTLLYFYAFLGSRIGAVLTFCPRCIASISLIFLFLFFFFKFGNILFLSLRLRYINLIFRTFLLSIGDLCGTRIWHNTCPYKVNSDCRQYLTILNEVGKSIAHGIIIII